MDLLLVLRRGHVGVGPLQRVFPAVDDLPRSNEDPRTGRGLAEFVCVKVRDPVHRQFDLPWQGGRNWMPGRR